jgi:hypothetical protein
VVRISHVHPFEEGQMHRFQYQLVKSSHGEAQREAADRRRATRQAARQAALARSSSPIVGQKPATRQVCPPRGLGRLRPANRW